MEIVRGQTRKGEAVVIDNIQICLEIQTNGAFRSWNGHFDDVKGIYDILAAILAQDGLTLDCERIKETRPKIAAILLE